MRLLYILPGSLSRTELGVREIERRRGILQRLAAPGTEVGITDVPDGPTSIESAYEEYLSVPGTLQRVQAAERDGYDAAIVGCFGDPGVDAARELVEMCVVGPAEASMLFACTLGHSFSVITVLESVVAPLRHLAHRIGVAQKVASVRGWISRSWIWGRTARAAWAAWSRLGAERSTRTGRMPSCWDV